MTGDAYTTPFHPEPRQLGFFVKKPLRPILPHFNLELEVKFWSLVERRGKNECWPWQGAMNIGYGAFWTGKTSFPAHRCAFALTTRYDPIDFMICHECDNPPCCNPAHHWCGNNLSNTADKRRKGRFICSHGGLKGALARGHICVNHENVNR